MIQPIPPSLLEEKNVLVAMQPPLPQGHGGAAAITASPATPRSRPFVVLGTGLAVTALALTLATQPWPKPFIEIPPWSLPLIAGAGTMIAVWSTRAPRGAVRTATVVLAAAVLLYPLFLGAANMQDPAAPGARVALTAAMTGHLLPIMLIELIPVLAARAVTRRRMRAWITILAAVNLADVVVMALASMVPDMPAAARVIGSALWIGGALIAPVATWRAVRGMAGTARHRAVLAAITSLIGLLILTFCNLLGLTEQAQRIGAEASVGLLMLGFSGATAVTAWGAVTAVGEASAWLLRPTVLGRALAISLTAAVALAASVLALSLLSSGAQAPDMVLLAITVSLAAGLAVARLHRWTTRIVDPVAELRAEYESGDPADPPAARIQRALQRVVGDPDLHVLLRAPDDAQWERASRIATTRAAAAQRGGAVAGRVLRIDRPDREVAPATTSTPVVLAYAPGTVGEPIALAIPTSSRTARRIRQLGDPSAVLWEAVLENDVERERRRADSSAAAERDRLRRDLHDGLQSRLLGIALNLQLGGRTTADPAARGLIGEAVGALRNAADEARTIADGRLPAVLQSRGLSAALTDLVGGLRPFVELDVPTERFPARIEETGYFIVSEAVGNAIKHGGAGHVQVRIMPSTNGRVVTITITDDGVGGADPRAGTGLRHLSERTAGSGGILVVRDAEPHGTIVEASLPCAS